MFPKYVLLSICAFIRVHFGRPGKFSQHSPFRCRHVFFFKNRLWSMNEFFQRKVGNRLFSKACRFLARQLIFSFSTFFLTCFLLFLFCSLFHFIHLIFSFLFLFLSWSFVYFFFLFVVFFSFFSWGILLPKHVHIFVRYFFAIYMHIQGILPPKHTYICFVRYIFFCYIHAHLRYLYT